MSCIRMTTVVYSFNLMSTYPCLLFGSLLLMCLYDLCPFSRFLNCCDYFIEAMFCKNVIQCDGFLFCPSASKHFLLVLLNPLENFSKTCPCYVFGSWDLFGVRMATPNYFVCLILNQFYVHSNPLEYLLKQSSSITKIGSGEV